MKHQNCKSKIPFVIVIPILVMLSFRATASPPPPSLNIIPSTTKEQLPSLQGWPYLQLIGQVGGLTPAVDIQGDYAYVGVGPRLVLLDVSEPTLPTRIGASDIFPEVILDVAVKGRHAYVAVGDIVYPSGDSYLRIVDVSDPTAPREVASHPLTGRIRDVALTDDSAYVIAGSGLHIIDISDPTNPSEVSTFTPTETPVNVAVIGTYAYLTDRDGNYPVGDGSLWIIDISNPSAPTQVGLYDINGSAQDLAVSGSYAFIPTADFTFGSLHIVDISDPANPTLASSYDIGLAGTIAAAGNYAYLTASSILYILDVSIPSAPTVAGSLPLPANASDLVLAGDHAFMASENRGVYIFDVATPSSPSEAGAFISSGSVFAVALGEDFAYTTGGLSLNTIDITDLATPIQIDSFPLFYEGTDVAVVGDTAYLVEGANNRLYIIDISDPANLLEIGTFITNVPVFNVGVGGNHAYLTDWIGVLHIVDVSDPTAPAELVIDTWPLPRVGDLVVRDPYLFTTGRGNVLCILNIESPADPQLIHCSELPGIGGNLAVAGNLAYVTRSFDNLITLYIFDVSDVSAPVEIGSYAAAGISGVSSISMTGDTAVLADNQLGIHILDVSDPTAPFEITSYNTPGEANDVLAAGNKIFVADGDGGLVILRLEPLNIYFPVYIER